MKAGILMSFIKWITSFFMAISMFFSSIFGLFSKPGPNVEPPVEEPRTLICGVCHPDDDSVQIKNAGLGWVRIDIPYPYNKNGSISAAYTAFKSRAKAFAEQGVKVLGITPYPRHYLSTGGFDPSTDENAQRTKDIAVFLCSDLRDVIGGLQITNEMNLSKFASPLTLEQAAKFIGFQAQVLSEVKGDLIIGYNSAGIGENLHALMQPYLPYMDYVGVDLYFGTHGDGTLQDFVSGVREINRLTGPVILTEFGFPGAGEPKSVQERAAVLARYGYESEEAARADIESFIEKLPEAFKSNVYQTYPDPAQWGDAVFKKWRTHFYGYIDCSIPGIPHTPEGQAEFYWQLIPLLKTTDCLAGFFIFRWQDSGVCSGCGQADCPFKSAWGLLDKNGEPKPAYYAVSEAIAAE